MFIESSPAFFNFFVENNLLSNILFFPSDDDSFVENMMNIFRQFQGTIYVKDNKELEFAEQYMDSPYSYVSATAIHVLSECLFFFFFFYISELSIFNIQEKIILKAVHVYSKIQENEDRNDFEYD